MHYKFILKFKNKYSIFRPWLPYEVLQSTNYYSENDSNFPFLMKFIPSTEPTMVKKGLAPHYNWFFTGVTAPAEVQFTD